MSIKDKIRGIVFGVALGDAMGGPLEFMTQSDIQCYYGGLVEDMVGGGWLDLEPGETTDDTAMTIGVLKGVLENWDSPIQNIGQQFLSWYHTNPKDIGIITKNAIELYDKHRDWEAAGRNAHEASGGKSAGNGSLMRCGPIAFLYKNDYKKMIEVTVSQSKMTHFDDLATEACCIYNHILWEIINKKSLKESIASALDQYDKDDRYGQCLRETIRYEELKPNGFVVDSLLCSLYSVLNTEDFYDAIVMAINLGGDADTIGAITGGMAGAYYGYESLPAVWVYQLKCFDELDELCKESIKFLDKKE